MRLCARVIDILPLCVGPFKVRSKVPPRRSESTWFLLMRSAYPAQEGKGETEEEVDSLADCTGALTFEGIEIENARV